VKLPGFFRFEQMGCFVTLYHVVSVILANATGNWGTFPTERSPALHIVVSRAIYAIWSENYFF
jgi:hypothetical protein